MSFEEAKEFVRKKFEDEERDASHDFSHVERVLKYCEIVGRKERADMEVLRYAALFHDYSRESPRKTKIDHAAKAVREVRRILPRFLPPKKVIEVQRAIMTHSKECEKDPETLEAKVLWDADKLDAIGPTGVARYMVRGGIRGWGIEQTIKRGLEKLDKIWERSFYTETAKKMSRTKRKKCTKLCDELLYDLNPNNFK